MSYPSQPSYTPPYGQPQPQPPRQTSLWLIGGAVIAVLIVVMTVTLLIVQRTAGSTEAGGGTDPTTPEQEPSSEAVETTPEDEPTPEETGDDGGDTTESAGFTEQTCGAFDLSGFEEVFGSAIDPDETSTSSSSSGDTGSLSCTFADDDYNTASIYVSSYGDADSTMEYLEDDREYWDNDEDYNVTDYTEFGDAGYHSVFGEDISQKREIHVVIGKLDIQVDTWIYVDDHDAAKADALLADLGRQCAELFDEYK
ncbi:hypothetical protein GCM10027447_32600 [Glycomyces halotolerans]